MRGCRRMAAAVQCSVGSHIHTWPGCSRLWLARPETAPHHACVASLLHLHTSTPGQDAASCGLPGQRQHPTTHASPHCCTYTHPHLARMLQAVACPAKDSTPPHMHRPTAAPTHIHTWPDCSKVWRARLEHRQHPTTRALPHCCTYTHPLNSSYILCAAAAGLESSTGCWMQGCTSWCPW
jgi:hypothetical protein